MNFYDAWFVSFYRSLAKQDSWLLEWRAATFVGMFENFALLGLLAFATALMGRSYFSDEVANVGKVVAVVVLVKDYWLLLRGGRWREILKKEETRESKPKMWLLNLGITAFFAFSFWLLLRGRR